MSCRPIYIIMPATATGGRESYTRAWPLKYYSKGLPKNTPLSCDIRNDRSSKIRPDQRPCATSNVVL